MPDYPKSSAANKRYGVRRVDGESDLKAARALRALAFGVAALGDADEIDSRADHFLLEDLESGTLVCYYRVLVLEGKDLPQSYAASFYELSLLAAYQGLMMELGRFCIHPEWNDPDILRAAWAAMAQHVDSLDVQMLFGCSSFPGVDTGPYIDSFALLKARYLGPDRWRPGVRAPEVFRYSQEVGGLLSTKNAMVNMPPMLRTYLLMGGWVSDHAVVDREMDTLHVFTGLEIGKIPPARKRLLRALV